MNARRLLCALSAAVLLAAPAAALADQGFHGQGDQHRWNHDQHRYWSRDRHRWIYDRHYNWNPAAYHWVPDHHGNFVLVRINL